LLLPLGERAAAKGLIFSGKKRSSDAFSIIRAAFMTLSLVKLRRIPLGYAFNKREAKPNKENIIRARWKSATDRAEDMKATER